MEPTEIGRIHLIPRSDSGCPECAASHDPSDPHDKDSLYYLNRFHRAHKRFPTWADAMAHCNELTKAYWRVKLNEYGVPPEELRENGS